LCWRVGQELRVAKDANECRHAGVRAHQFQEPTKPFERFEQAAQHAKFHSAQMREGADIEVNLITLAVLKLVE
jgi:hypothetical protein